LVPLPYLDPKPPMAGHSAFAPFNSRPTVPVRCCTKCRERPLYLMTLGISRHLQLGPVRLPGSVEGVPMLSLGLLIGGRYRYMETISSGRFAHVVRVEDMYLPGRMLAMKIMFASHGKIGEEEGAVLRWLAYVCWKKYSMSLNLMHLLPIYAAFYEGSHYCLVMPIQSGNLLAAMQPSTGFLRSPLLTLSVIRKILWQLLESLSFIHGQDYIHADLKPENILCATAALSDGARVVVADLGNCIHLSHRSLYRGNFQIQSLMYRAPEVVLQQEDWNCAIDIWSIGCIAVELIRGHSLWDDAPDLQVQSLSLTPAMQKQLQQVPTAVYPETLQLITAMVHHLGAEPPEFWGNSASKDLPDDEPLPASRATLLRSQPWLLQLPLRDEQLFDLLSRMLRWNPSDRISAVDALAHPFFHALCPGRLVLTPRQGKVPRVSSPVDTEAEEETEQAHQLSPGAKNRSKNKNKNKNEEKEKKKKKKREVHEYDYAWSAKEVQQLLEMRRLPEMVALMAEEEPSVALTCLWQRMRQEYPTLTATVAQMTELLNDIVTFPFPSHPQWPWLSEAVRATLEADFAFREHYLQAHPSNSLSNSQSQSQESESQPSTSLWSNAAADSPVKVESTALSEEVIDLLLALRASSKYAQMFANDMESEACKLMLQTVKESFPTFTLTAEQIALKLHQLMRFQHNPEFRHYKMLQQIAAMDRGSCQPIMSAISSQITERPFVFERNSKKQRH
jgi:serine/threonine protein kinase